MRYRPLLDFLRRVYALLSSTGEAETHDQELDCFGSRATCMSFHRLALSSRIISLFYAVLVEFIGNPIFWDGMEPRPIYICHGPVQVIHSYQLHGA